MKLIALGVLAVATPLFSGCSTIEKTTNGLYEAVFPSANFDPKKYEAVAFDYATSPSAADQNRNRKMRFDAYYFGVTGNVSQKEIISQHIYVTLCEDRARQQCATKIAVHDLDSKSVTSIPRGSAVTFYGMVGEIQALDYGGISVTNRDGSLSNAVFFLKAHKILPR